MAVVIPCYNEPDFPNTMESLLACQPPPLDTAIIVVVNHGTKAPQRVIEQNIRTLQYVAQKAEQLPYWAGLFCIDAMTMSPKHAGAGWARKAGMDHAISLFNENNFSDGIIVSLDADTLVQPNYLIAIHEYFATNKEKAGATIYFEHPISEGIEGEAMACYELYMRYYKNALQLSGFPHSIYTVGSAFTVKASAYIAQGGMNRRKAGEDFYFLNKLLQFGPIGEINSTKVFPSARISDRVPFGTGPALKKHIEGSTTDLLFTYRLDAFLALQGLFEQIGPYYLAQNKGIASFGFNECLIEFLKEIVFENKLYSLKSNCSNVEVFKKRFFHLFNAFTILKWLNFADMTGYPKAKLFDEAENLLKHLGIINLKKNKNNFELLLIYRQFDGTTDK